MSELTTEQVEALADGCDACRGQTFEDGMVCCWACTRVMPALTPSPQDERTTHPESRFDVAGAETGQP